MNKISIKGNFNAVGASVGLLIGAVIGSVPLMIGLTAAGYFLGRQVKYEQTKFLKNNL